MSMELIRELWEYHHWANRRLFTVAVALGEEETRREIGTIFSAPTLREMFVHLYGADRFWLRRWTGEPAGAPGPSYGLAIAMLGDLRRPWDDLVAEHAGLGEADLSRVFEVTSADGSVSPRPFGMMLLHVPNHATHHRSEIATMLTMASGSPPDTGINTYYLQRSAGR